MDTTRELLRFIEKSPSMFHSIQRIREYLDGAGFTYLPEPHTWELAKGGVYYKVRGLRY